MGARAEPHLGQCTTLRAFLELVIWEQNPQSEVDAVIATAETSGTQKGRGICGDILHEVLAGAGPDSKA